MLLLLSNNVQVLKIVALVQDSNLIIGKVHGFLMLYASQHLGFCQLLRETGLHPNFASLPCLHLYMYTWCIKEIYLAQKFNFETA